MESVPVLLLAPINTPLNIPGLGVSILKAGLAEHGINCRIIYLNHLFHEAVGPDRLTDLFRGASYNLAFERLFAPFAHDEMARGNLLGLNGDEVPQDLKEYYRVLNCLNRNFSAARYSELERQWW